MSESWTFGDPFSKHGPLGRGPAGRPVDVGAPGPQDPRRRPVDASEGNVSVPGQPRHYHGRAAIDGCDCGLCPGPELNDAIQAAMDDDLER
ncbi:hypothetical protein PBI_DEWDROP_56 [Microbacterium phage Dewdrop]|nr:hypothetical protein PBI_LEAF_56 [Microbacterium phage Leaf]QGZ17425.1 hypothetical protein PBI_DEWDROP_56 [Microbacterium phage Dewdrop]